MYNMVKNYSKFDRSELAVFNAFNIRWRAKIADTYL